MEWQSVEQIVKELELLADAEDVSAVRAEIKARLKHIHPDNLGSEGTFESSEDKERFLRCTSAIEFIDRALDHDKALAPIEKSLAIIEQLAGVLSLQLKSSLEEKAPQMLAQGRDFVGRKFLGIKITNAGFTAFLAYVFLFPQQIEANPYLKYLFGSVIGPKMIVPVALWVLAVAVLSVCWYRSALLEQRCKQEVERLFSYDWHILALEEWNRRSVESRPMARHEIKNILVRNIDDHAKRLISELVIEQATELAIERYLSRGWVRRVEKKGVLGDWFEVVTSN